MKKLGNVNAMYPSLTTIVGATVRGKPKFVTIAHVGIMNHGKPQYISLGMGKVHCTNQGIHENGTFSVNIPSKEMVVETDDAGIVSGKKTDKSKPFDRSGIRHCSLGEPVASCWSIGKQLKRVPQQE